MTVAARSIRSLFHIGLLALVTGCSGAWVPFSAGELEGAVAPVPATWGSIADLEVVRLETQGDTPYSVNLWIIELDNSLYVHAGANRATWVEHMETNADVRFAANAQIYELRADRVTSQGEFDRFSDAYEVKYGRRPRSEDVKEAYLFRLDLRPEEGSGGTE